MERYWVEPQRHERIAVMMTGKGPDPATLLLPSSSSTTASSRVQDAKRKPSTSSSPNDLKTTRSPSPGFCPGLVVDVDADAMEDEPDLEAIKIAARIK